jgi:ABC-2 type transport system ATP-binding protein
MNFNVEVKDLFLSYKEFAALKYISFRLEDKKIYGLIGRNGAGKTSLLSLLASLREPTKGSITIAGVPPMENPEIMQNVAFIHQSDYRDETSTVKGMLELVSRYRPHYDAEYARYLVQRFQLPTDKAINKLSQGMQSVLDVIIGLAGRASITIFDEAYLGMDAPTRMIFYQEILDDQAKFPRMFIISTHLVSEMDYLFDEVLILHQGRLVLKEEYEALLSRGLTITGSAAEVEEFVQDMHVIGEQQLGKTKAVMVFADNNAENNEEPKKKAQMSGFEVSQISLQDLFIHLTDEREEN